LALPVVIGIGVAVTSCGSAHDPVPAGYTRVGGAAQGISIAVPSSWVAGNLAKENIQSAASKAGLSDVVQDMESLQKLHAVFVFDVKSAVDSPQYLVAYCGDAQPAPFVGAAGLPLLKELAVAEWEKLGATQITQKDLQIGGVPGVETSYQRSSPSAGTFYGSQLEVLPRPDKACFVTLTVSQGESAGNVLSVAAATAQFP
jgi:hypothetical protein